MNTALRSVVPSRLALAAALSVGCSTAPSPQGTTGDVPPADVSQPIDGAADVGLDTATDDTATADADTPTPDGPPEAGSDVAVPDAAPAFAWNMLRCDVATRAIWAANATNVYFATDRGLLRYRGGALTTEFTGSVNAVWGRSATEVFALVGLEVRVSSGDGRWQAHSRMPMESYTTGQLTGSATELFAIAGDEGGFANALRWEASTGWRRLETPRLDQRGIWVAREGEIYVTQLGCDPVSHYRENVRQPRSTGAFPSGFKCERSGRSVWGSSPSDVYLLATSADPSEPLGLFHSDGTNHWTRLSQPMLSPDEGLLMRGAVRVWGTGPSDIYVVEERGALWHFDGVAWTREVVPGAREPRLIWGTPAGELFLAGACIQHRVPTEP